MLNGHGDDIHNYGTGIVSNFSSNIFNGLDMSALDSFIARQVKNIHSYPEPDAASLAQALAHRHGVDRENICVTNGATEAIYLIAQAFAGRNCQILIPTFSEYEDACRIHKLDISFIRSLDEVAHPDLLWICNPNNPTGKSIDKDILLSFIASKKHTTIVIDCSYQYFTATEAISASDVSGFDNVILLQSMTKRFAIPGLRLGYIIACEQLALQVGRQCMPWSVNRLAQDAGVYLTANEALFPFDIDGYLRETKIFRQQLSALDKLDVYPSDTHFFLCRLHDRTAAQLKDHLANGHGILIRDAANFRGLDKHYFRLATQTASENTKLVEILQAWL